MAKNRIYEVPAMSDEVVTPDEQPVLSVTDVPATTAAAFVESERDSAIVSAPETAVVAPESSAAAQDEVNPDDLPLHISDWFQLRWRSLGYELSSAFVHWFVLAEGRETATMAKFDAALEAFSNTPA